MSFNFFTQFVFYKCIINVYKCIFNSFLSLLLLFFYNVLFYILIICSLLF